MKDRLHRGIIEIVKQRTRYELRLGRRVVWKGRDLVRALPRMEKRFGAGRLAIHVIFREGLLIAIHL